MAQVAGREPTLSAVAAAVVQATQPLLQTGSSLAAYHERATGIPALLARMQEAFDVPEFGDWFVAYPAWQKAETAGCWRALLEAASACPWTPGWGTVLPAQFLLPMLDVLQFQAPLDLELRHWQALQAAVRQVQSLRSTLQAPLAALLADLALDDLSQAAWQSSFATIEDLLDADGRVAAAPGSTLAHCRDAALAARSRVRDVARRELRSKRWQALAVSPEPVQVDGETCLLVQQVPPDANARVISRSRRGESWYIQTPRLQQANTDAQQAEQAVVREEYRLLADALTALLEPALDWVSFGVYCALQERLSAQLPWLGRVDDWVVAAAAATEDAPVEQLQLQMHNPQLHLLRAADSIPFDIQHSTRRPCLVTGPNAGGKSAYLATLAQLHFLRRSGLLPAHLYPFVPWPGALWFDGGDHQDVLLGESSYSAHVRFLAEVAADAAHQDWVVVDEIGGKTDPVEGGAMAVAWLAYMAQRCDWLVVSSHNAVVKDFAGQQQWDLRGLGVDAETLRPEYRVRFGVVAASYAIEAAARSDMPATIVEQARAFVAARHVPEEDLDRLEQQRHKLEQAIAAQQQEQARLQQANQELAHSEAQRIREAFAAEYRHMLRAAGKQVEQANTRSKVRKAGLPEARQKFLQGLHALEQQHGPEAEAPTGSPASSARQNTKVRWRLEPGNRVRDVRTGILGAVKAVPTPDSVTVALDNGMEMTLELQRVEPVLGKAERGEVKIVRSEAVPELSAACATYDQANAEILLSLMGVPDHEAIEAAEQAWNAVLVSRRCNQLRIEGRRRERLEPILSAITARYGEQPQVRRAPDGRSWILTGA